MDEHVLDLLQLDVDAGFERVVTAYQHRLFAYALALSGRPADAEEVAQDALIRAHRALRSYPPERIAGLKLRPWLHRIALNVHRNRIRGRRIDSVPLEVVAEPAAPAIEQPEAAFARHETGDQLRCLLARLPQRYREAVVLRHVQGLSYAESAEVLQVPEGTVKSDVHRGLATLRNWLESTTMRGVT